MLIAPLTDAADLRQCCFAHLLSANADTALFDLQTTDAAWRGLVSHNPGLSPNSARDYWCPKTENQHKK